MAEKVHKCGVKREKGFLYFVDASGDIARVKQGQSSKEVVCKNDNNFTKEAGWMYYVDKNGDVSRSRLKSFKEYAEVRDDAPIQLYAEKNWTGGANSPEQKGKRTK